MKSYFPLLISLLAIIPAYYCTSAADVEKVSYRNYKLYQVNGTADDIQDIAKFVNSLTPNSTILYDGYSTSLWLIIPPKYVDAFKGYVEEHNFTHKAISQDFQQYVDDEKAVKGSPFSWNAYFDIPDIYAYLSNASSDHQKIAQVIKGGSSYEGRDILGLHINTGGSKEKPAFYIESGIHAREWIAPAAATYFIHQLLTSKDSKISAMRDQFDWHIFPCINPDGYHYSYTTDRFWRKNRSKSPSGCHGVDLNRNWDTENWMKYSASNDSCDLNQYAGLKPFSEPETLSMSQYISKIPNLKVFTSWHSDLEMLLIPYSGSDERVDNYDDLMKIGKTSLDYAFRVNGARYEGPGQAKDISYKASGESIDWAKLVLKVPLAFEYELRGVLFDWPPSRIYEQGEEFTQMILGLVTEAKQLGYFGETRKSMKQKNHKFEKQKISNSEEPKNPKSEEPKIHDSEELKNPNSKEPKIPHSEEQKNLKVDE